MPKLSGTARRRREAQLRLEQSNAWLQKRLQAIDGSAGRAYSPDRAHSPDKPDSPSARQRLDKEPQSAPASHPQQHALTRGSPDLWSGSIAAVHGSGSSFLENDISAADQGLQLRRESPVPGLDLAGIRDKEASAVAEENVVNS